MIPFEKEFLALQRDIVMLLTVLARRGILQTPLIHEFASVGFRTKRIAELLGTTPNTVNVTLQKAKNKAKTKKRRNEIKKKKNNYAGKNRKTA